MADTVPPVPPIQWHLHEMMARRGIRFSSQLHARLVDVLGDDAPGEGQVRKLVRQTPSRVTLRTLAGLCVVLDCEPGQLLTYRPPAEPEWGQVLHRE